MIAGSAHFWASIVAGWDIITPFFPIHDLGSALLAVKPAAVGELALPAAQAVKTPLAVGSEPAHLSPPGANHVALAGGERGSADLGPLARAATS